jgi:hypothetical protein
MVLLKVDLQDGFAGDLVIAKVNDNEVFRKEGITTRLTLGLADSFEVDIAEGKIKIDVTLPMKDVFGTILLEMSGPVFLGVSVEDHRISFKRSEVMFFYL